MRIIRQENFFSEMLKKFSKEKDEEGLKQEFTARRQGRNEDPRKYHTGKLRLCRFKLTPKPTLSVFKNAIIMGRLYHMELQRTCLQFMPKDLQYKHHIKAVLIL